MISQQLLDRYFKGSRAEYVANLEKNLAAEQQRASRLSEQERGRANQNIARLQAVIAENKPA